VAAIRLGGAGDRVAWAGAVPPRGDLLLMGEDGRAKRVAISEFPRQARNGVGTKAWKSEAGGRLVGAAAGLAETRILVGLRGAAAQTVRLGDFPRRKRTAEPTRPAALKGRKVTALIALDSPVPGAGEKHRAPSGSGGKSKKAGPSRARKTKRPAEAKASGRARG
jgi:DNA gyrase/topoisomerase IV subunit A